VGGVGELYLGRRIGVFEVRCDLVGLRCLWTDWGFFIGSYIEFRMQD